MTSDYPYEGTTDTIQRIYDNKVNLMTLVLQKRLSVGVAHSGADVR